jgi:hypothetical protein
MERGARRRELDARPRRAGGTQIETKGFAMMRAKIILLSGPFGFMRLEPDDGGPDIWFSTSKVAGG